MKVIRLLLLMFMAFVVLGMLVWPGLYDSKRRFSSHRQFSEARRQHEIAPTPETQRAFDAAKGVLEDAKRLDRRDIMVFEVFMLGILGVSVYAFICAGKSVQKISAA
jgi:predicted alternative tryptophan synthase beta-subunit